MTTVAIICEYNPFHLGHLHQVETIRKEFGDDVCIVALMSGNFVQRGTPAIFDKFTRAKAAVQCGVNLVLEFPFPFCSSGANYFARNAIHILNELCEIDYLSFGVEENNIVTFNNVVNIICSEEYEQALAEEIKTSNKNMGFAEIREKVLLSLCRDLSSDFLRKPNNILAIEYLVALRQKKSKIKPHLLKRTIDYHANSASENGIASASFIRKLFNEKKVEDAIRFVPNCVSALYKNSFLNGFFAEQEFCDIGKMLLSYLRLSKKTADIFECTEDLSHRIRNASIKAKNYNDLIEFTQSSHLTKARVQRAILHSWLETPSSTAEEVPMYTQLLATDAKGMNKLKQLNKHSHIKILVKAANTHLLCPRGIKQADFCAKADSVYSLLQPGLGRGDEFFRISPYCVR